MRKILELIAQRKDELEDIRKSGWYNAEYIEKKRQDFIGEVKAAKDKHFEDKAKEVEAKLKEVMKKYDKGSLDYNKKLYDMQRITNKVKMMGNEELQSFAQGLQGDFLNCGYSVEELEIIGAELNSRDTNAAAHFMDAYKAANLEAPWENDPEFQQLSIEFNNAKGEIGYSNIVLDSGRENWGTVLVIEDELK